MERHRGNLEAQSDQDQPCPQEIKWVFVIEPLSDRIELERTGRTVEKCTAVEQQTRSEGTDQEILEGRLIGLQRSAPESGQGVDGNAHHLEGQEEHEQIRRCDQEHHPDY